MIVNTYEPVIKPSRTSFGHTIECYEGCGHGCHYCYARWFKSPDSDKLLGHGIPYSQWINATPYPHLVENLTTQLQRMRPSTKAGIKDIMISSLTDCYQTIEQTHRITMEVVTLLIKNDLPFTVLTKNKNVLDDIDLFKGYDKCRVGLTIVTMDEDYRKQQEPLASTINERIEALKNVHDAGISTYCSVEPMMDDERSNPIDIVEKLKGYIDLFEFGKLNPVHNDDPDYKKEYFINTFNRINDYCDNHGINYCHAGHSKDFLKQNGIKFIPCPTVLP